MYHKHLQRDISKKSYTVYSKPLIYLTPLGPETNVPCFQLLPISILIQIQNKKCKIYNNFLISECFFIILVRY